MDSFTVELVSNASGKLFPDNTPSSFTKLFNRTSKFGGVMGGCNFRNILPINVPKYQNITEGIFKFFDTKLSKSTSTYSIEPGLYTFIKDIVEATNTFFKRETTITKLA